MSDLKELVDGYIVERDQFRNQAAMWQYIATLLMIEDGRPEVRFPRKKRDVGRRYLQPEEMKGGALKVKLFEAPDPEPVAGESPDGT